MANVWVESLSLADIVNEYFVETAKDEKDKSSRNVLTFAITVNESLEPFHIPWVIGWKIFLVMILCTVSSNQMPLTFGDCPSVVMSFGQSRTDIVSSDKKSASKIFTRAYYCSFM